MVNSIYAMTPMGPAPIMSNEGPIVVKDDGSVSVILPTNNNVEVSDHIKLCICSACGQEGKETFSYNIFKIERKICDLCFLKNMDKLFGVKSNPELEVELYGK